ncbi:hypothetical protein [Aporhodopirellula aestuarii]|uniref:Uncharacterized protein n=1 Tax=Aporhodopirellula aestuarii TaxID=2950107 RepID=A0ABT0U414_9BACT|nr:hypothetical protein [Aporhodopirellula aestuarii]MCM2371662.1 hypothetical protein [Aporhodopirellula aestuarii]
MFSMRLSCSKLVRSKLERSTWQLCERHKLHANERRGPCVVVCSKDRKDRSKLVLDSKQVLALGSKQELVLGSKLVLALGSKRVLVLGSKQVLALGSKQELVLGSKLALGSILARSRWLFSCNRTSRRRLEEQQRC